MVTADAGLCVWGLPRGRPPAPHASTGQGLQPWSHRGSGLTLEVWQGSVLEKPGVWSAMRPAPRRGTSFLGLPRWTTGVTASTLVAWPWLCGRGDPVPLACDGLASSGSPAWVPARGPSVAPRPLGLDASPTGAETSAHGWARSEARSSSCALLFCTSVRWKGLLRLVNAAGEAQGWFPVCVMAGGCLPSRRPDKKFT